MTEKPTSTKPARVWEADTGYWAKKYLEEMFGHTHTKIVRPNRQPSRWLSEVWCSYHARWHYSLTDTEKSKVIATGAAPTRTEALARLRSAKAKYLKQECESAKVRIRA